MAPRCGVCSGSVERIGSVICTDKCGAVYHIGCATDEFGCDPSDFSNSAPFRCDSCSKHRLSVAPRTPEGGSSSSTTVTLDDVMQQLKFTDVVLQQLRPSSGVVDLRLALIQDLLAEMEPVKAGIRSDVSD